MTKTDFFVEATKYLNLKLLLFSSVTMHYYSVAAADSKMKILQ